MKGITASAEVKGGKLVLKNTKWFRYILSRFPDGKVRVSIEKEGGARSNQQNKFLWGVVYELIAAHIGETPEEVHEVMKSLYLRKKRVWRGNEMTILKSTTELTTAEFAEYVDRVRQQGAELGVVIPDPDKNWYVKEEFMSNKT